MARKDANPGADARVAQRQRAALEYRKQGLPYRGIAQALGVSHQQAFRDVRSAIKEFRAATKETTEELVHLERESLDMASVAIASQVTRGDLKAVEVWIKLSESRRKLLGLDADSNLEQLLKLIDLSKLSPEQLDRLSKGEHPIKVLFG